MNIFFVILLIMLSAGNFAAAQEAEIKNDPGEVSALEAESEEPYVFPVIKPAAFLFGGYRFADINGSAQAAEYEYLHNSVMLGGDLRLFPFPHRFHLEADEKNKKDYSGEINYAYEDMVIFRAIDRTMFHNLDNLRLVDLDPATANFKVDPRDSNQIYGTKFSINTFFVRLKTHDFPFHIYFDGSLVDNNGTIQQMSVLGDTSRSSLGTRTSQARNIDWETRNMVVGVNSHLGPVEVDVSHDEKRFSTDGNKVLYDSYATTTTAPGRAADIYPHNLIPELKGSTSTIKLHTSYTGGLVASATFSTMHRENTDSGPKADYFFGSGDLTWTASPALSFFGKYRHKEADLDNVQSVTISGLTNPAHTYTYPVLPSISYISDFFSGTLRYRIVPGVSIRGEYTLEEVRRKNSDLWNVPEKTTRNTASLSADIRIARTLSLKAKYTHRDIENPDSNVEPEHSDEGKVSLSWVPVPGVSTLVSYIISDGKRSDLAMTGVSSGQPAPENRDLKSDRLLGTVTLLMLKNLTCNASYSYMHYKLTQDIAIGNITDPSVPYKILSHGYMLDINYAPAEKISLRGSMSLTANSGKFFPNNSTLTSPDDVASFSELKTRETVYSASAEYMFKGGFTAALRYRYSNLNDLIDNPYDDVSDGTAHIIMLTLSKRW